MIRAKSPIWENLEQRDGWAATDRLRKAGELPPEDFELDFDDPPPVIALMNPKIASQRLDPVEVYYGLEPFDAVIFGDVETCRRKLALHAEVGVDRLMRLMQMERLPHERVLNGIRTAGKQLIPQLAAVGRYSTPRLSGTG